MIMRCSIRPFLCVCVFNVSRCFAYMSLYIMCISGCDRPDLFLEDWDFGLEKLHLNVVGWVK